MGSSVSNISINTGDTGIQAGGDPEDKTSAWVPMAASVYCVRNSINGPAVDEARVDLNKFAEVQK